MVSHLDQFALADDMPLSRVTCYGLQNMKSSRNDSHMRRRTSKLADEILDNADDASNDG